MINDYFETGDPSRWVVLALFCLFSASNAIQWITYAPIAITVKEFFRLSTNEVNLLSTVYMIIFVVGVYFSTTTFEKWGVRQGLIVGSFLNALGSILKVVYGMQYPGFAPLIISQTINSIAQLFVLSTPPVIAAQYFPPPKRAFATNLATTANNLGNAVALFIPPFIVRKGTAAEFYLLFGLEMVVCVLILGLIFFFVQPPRFQGLNKTLLNTKTPAAVADSALSGEVGNRLSDQPRELAEMPVGAQEPLHMSSPDNFVNPHLRDDPFGCKKAPQQGAGSWFAVLGEDFVQEVINVGRTIGKLCRTSDFLFLFGAFSISMGSVWTYASVLSQVLYPFGVSAQLAGIASAMNVVAGTISSFFVCAWVDRKRRYKYPIIICLTGALLSCLGLLILMIRAPSPSSIMNVLSTTFVIVAGVFQITTIPICFEFAMEISFPLQESVPGSMLMAGANLSSLILVTASSYILGDDDPTKRTAVNVIIMIVSISVVGALLVLPPREKLNRRDAELLVKEQLNMVEPKDLSAGAAPNRKLA
ncbi:unnamed protein product [Phytomonas sp. Hart1]|nr:unnamed protein product [Phytomonas sp. Hart1]|eukprot:CCW67217.1 unnamed protein product [Phytomonas sp. isolate Hart1]